ncbi:MAG: carboxymuconolactone decarboxylase family protein [Gammaproteobacteria bacterium]|jgi:alkylhydroperoxidase family enzyme|nr:carboxymuconolactone decarboxylase family protein [Gammaproteobacteria bacterium]MDP6615985.1 carboxymuconolactone decarboxylase family protein [Gammaproteobacteria bacterium]MDP6694888.1 carboxymuconolactone decarboxylase family protein [Gammaproteobacteria bacterium]MDP7041370.1 carboxymuconolactone decarboxylase family protein [Gammaproteobacteria bacterium]
MARIPYPDPESLPDDDREFLANLPQLNISRMLAGSPSMFQPLTRVFNAYLNNGVLDTELREIVILRVAHLRESYYELENHKRAARVLGMSPERIDALEPGKSLDEFTEQEQLVIKFTDEVVLDGGASPETFTRVNGFMNTAELIELTVVIGVYTMVSQICETFDIEFEENPIAETGIDDIGKAVSKL